jgi:hypothetical protein
LGLTQITRWLNMGLLEISSENLSHAATQVRTGITDNRDALATSLEQHRHRARASVRVGARGVLFPVSRAGGSLEHPQYGWQSGATGGKWRASRGRDSRKIRGAAIALVIYGAARAIGATLLEDAPVSAAIKTAAHPATSARHT